MLTQSSDKLYSVTEAMQLTGKILAVCLFMAAKTYSIPPPVLVGIYTVKGGDVGEEFGPLKNGSYDLGPMKINTSKLPQLAKLWSVDTLVARHWVRDDPCTNMGVAAWTLRNKLNETGNLLNAIENYQSGTLKDRKIFGQKVIRAMERYGLIVEK